MLSCSGYTEGTKGGMLLIAAAVLFASPEIEAAGKCFGTYADPDACDKFEPDKDVYCKLDLFGVVVKDFCPALCNNCASTTTTTITSTITATTTTTTTATTSTTTVTSATSTTTVTGTSSTVTTTSITTTKTTTTTATKTSSTATATTTTFVCRGFEKGDDAGCQSILKLFKCDEAYVDGTETGLHCPVSCDRCQDATTTKTKTTLTTLTTTTTSITSTSITTRTTSTTTSTITSTTVTSLTTTTITATTTTVTTLTSTTITTTTITTTTTTSKASTLGCNEISSGRVFLTAPYDLGTTACKEEVDRLYLLLKRTCPALTQDVASTTTTTIAVAGSGDTEVCAGTNTGDAEGCEDILKLFSCDEKYIDGTETGLHCPITCDRCADVAGPDRERRADELDVLSCTPQALAITTKYTAHCDVMSAAIANLATGIDPDIRGGQGPDLTCLGGGAFISFANLTTCKQTVNALNLVLHDDRHGLTVDYPDAFDLCHGPTTVTTSETTTGTSTASSTGTTKVVGPHLACDEDGHFHAGDDQTYIECLGYSRKLNRMIKVCSETIADVRSTCHLTCDGEGRIIANKGDPFALNTIVKDLLSYEAEDFSPMSIGTNELLTAAIGCGQVASLLGQAIVAFELNDYRVCDWTTATTSPTTTAVSTITTTASATEASTQTSTQTYTAKSTATTTATTTAAITETTTLTSTATTTPITAAPLFKCTTFDQGNVVAQGIVYDPILVVEGFFECQQLANLFNQLAQLCTPTPELTCTSIGDDIYSIAATDDASCETMVAALTAVDSSLNQTPLKDTVQQLTCASKYVATNNCERAIEAYTRNQQFLVPTALQTIVQSGYTCECPVVDTDIFFSTGPAFEALDSSLEDNHNSDMTAKLKKDMLPKLATDLKTALAPEPETSTFEVKTFDWNDGKAVVAVHEELAIGSGGRCGTLEAELQVLVSGTFEFTYRSQSIWSGSPPAASTASKSSSTPFIIGALVIVALGIIAFVLVKRESAQLALPTTDILVSGVAQRRTSSEDNAPLDDDKPAAFFQATPSVVVVQTPETKFDQTSDQPMFAVTRRASFNAKTQRTFDGFAGGATNDEGVAAAEETVNPIVVGIASDNQADVDVDAADSEPELEPQAQPEIDYVAKTMVTTAIREQAPAQRGGANPQGKRWQSNMQERMSKFSSSGSMSF